MGETWHPDFGQQVKYNFSALPEAPDAQVDSTVKRIIRYIRQDACSPYIQGEAQKMMALSPDPNQAVWSLLKPSMKFKNDEEIASILPDERAKDVVEVLIRPVDQWLLIQMKGLGIGDCDCYSMYAGCLLHSLGVPCSLCTIAADGGRPQEFSHIYLVSYWNGSRMPLDISHGEYSGWESPTCYRKKEWKINLTHHEMLMDSAVALGGIAAAYFGFRWLVRSGNDARGGPTG